MFAPTCVQAGGRICHNKLADICASWAVDALELIEGQDLIKSSVPESVLDSLLGMAPRPLGCKGSLALGREGGLQGGRWRGGQGVDMGRQTLKRHFSKVNVHRSSGESFKTQILFE